MLLLLQLSLYQRSITPLHRYHSLSCPSHFSISLKGFRTYHLPGKSCMLAPPTHDHDLSGIPVDSSVSLGLENQAIGGAVEPRSWLEKEAVMLRWSQDRLSTSLPLFLFVSSSTRNRHPHIYPCLLSTGSSLAHLLSSRMHAIHVVTTSHEHPHSSGNYALNLGKTAA